MKKILYIFLTCYPILIYPTTSSHIYVTANIIYLPFFVCIMWLLLAKQIIFDKKKFTYSNKKYFLLIGLFILLLLLSTIFSVDPLHSLYGEYLRYEGLTAWLCYLSLFFFAYNYIKVDRESLFKLFFFLIISATLISFYGILQHFLLDFLPRPEHRVGYTRSYSFFGNPNFFGSYLVLMIFISLAIFFSGKSKKVVLFSYIAVQVNFLALIYSLTRSAWLGTFAGFVTLFVFILWKRRDLIRKFISISIGFLFVLIIVQTTEDTNYFARGTSIIHDASEILVDGNEGHAGSSRWYIWKNALPLVNDYFFIGSGPDTFALVFPHNEEELEEFFNNKNIIVDKAHNEYLQIAVTLGVPALVIYLLLVSIIIYKCLKVIFVTKHDYQIMLVCMNLAVIGYLAQAFFNISVITVAPYYWILLGIIYSVAEKVKITDINKLA